MFCWGTQAGRNGRSVLAACALAGLAAVAGCTSGAGAGAPSAAGGLGSGVRVESPRSASAGTDSPQAVMIGVVTAYSTGRFADSCKYEEPSQQFGCTSAWSPGPPGSHGDTSELPFFRNVKPGYTAIDGDKALVGFTGTRCILKELPSCITNDDPAAVLDSGKSFSTLWSQSLTSLPTVYALIPAIKVNGSWYVYTVNSTPVL